MNSKNIIVLQITLLNILLGVLMDDWNVKQLFLIEKSITLR